MTEPDAVPANAATKTRRKRRSTEEVVGRILAAAADEFERLGYAGATTASIARRAGVAEALIFSNFGTKARLFQASVFKPLSEHLLTFVGTHLVDATDAGHSHDALRRRYVMELEAFLARHSRKVLSLLYARLYGDGNQGLDAMDGIQDYFDTAVRIQTARSRREPKVDPAIIARLSFAAILSAVVMRDWLFPPGRFDDAAIDAALLDFVIDGLNANPE